MKKGKLTLNITKQETGEEKNEKKSNLVLYSSLILLFII
jgi:hypothetical protein